MSSDECALAASGGFLGYGIEELYMLAFAPTGYIDKMGNCGDPTVQDCGYSYHVPVYGDSWVLGFLPGSDGGVSPQALRSEILDRLLRDPNCLSFLGRNDPNALRDIATVPISVADLNNQAMPAMAYVNLSPTSLVPSSASIRVNRGGTFFTTGSQMTLFGTSRVFMSGTPQLQAAVLLHEFGHVTGALLQDDAFSAQAQGANNRALLSNCNRTINSFSNGAHCR